jgi:hypothetical protein
MNVIRLFILKSMKKNLSLIITIILGAVIIAILILVLLLVDSSEKCEITLFNEQYDITYLEDNEEGELKRSIFSCGKDNTDTFRSKFGDDLTRIAPYRINK